MNQISACCKKICSMDYCNLLDFAKPVNMLQHLSHSIIEMCAQLQLQPARDNLAARREIPAETSLKVMKQSKKHIFFRLHMWDTGLSTWWRPHSSPPSCPPWRRAWWNVCLSLHAEPDLPNKKAIRSLNNSSRQKYFI
jgi:hypothetical protein